MTSRPPSSALVGAAALAAEVGTGGLLLLDVRWTTAGPDRDAYRAAHLPGAVFVDLDADLAGPPGDGGRHPLPAPDAFTATMRRLGVSPGRRVVVYDAGGTPPFAPARAWWCLRYFGHDDVRVLDGGLAAWRAAGGEVEAGEMAPVADARAAARPGGLPAVTVDDVTGAAGLIGTATALVDVRAPERFAGRTEPIDPVAGHIPGAVNLPVTQVVDARGRLLAPESLRAALEAVAGSGVARSDGVPVTAYCGSGVTAALMVLALHEAGTPAALYPGSWSEWIRDPSRPVARSANPT